MSGIRPDMMQEQQHLRSLGDRGEFEGPNPASGQYGRQRNPISEQEAGAFITMKPQKEHVHRFAGFGVGLAGICAEHVLSHPCIVLRRQCQVHTTATWFHTTPFTLLPVIFNIQRNQLNNVSEFITKHILPTVTTMWKGIGSAMTVKGLAVASESLISEFTPLPKEANRHSSMKKLAEHLLLKGLSIVIVTPFYAASLVETVQSEIASERPGVFDCLREGTNRLLGWSSLQTTRLLPVWSLLLPSLLHGLGHYTITSLAQYTVLVSIRSEMQESKDQLTSSESMERALYETRYAELIATFTGNLLADMMLYPLETVLHRLCLQGTRTIIDNTDTGIGVMPIITRYEGMYDCFCGILREEGIMGLYKGFGALVLQYSLHVAILKLTKFIFEQLAQKIPQPASSRQATERARLIQGRVPGSGTPPYPPQYYPPPGYSGHQDYPPYHQQPGPSYYSPNRPPQQPYSPNRHHRDEFTAL